MENNRIKVKHRNGLAPKLIIGIVLISVLTAFASTFIGARIYWKDITNHYDALANKIANIVEGITTADELSYWSDVAKRYAAALAALPAPEASAEEEAAPAEEEQPPADLTVDDYIVGYIEVVKTSGVDEALINEVVSVLENKNYRKLLNDIDMIRASIEANDIYVTVVDLEELDAYTPETVETREWRPLVYIFDTYPDPSWWFPFGFQSTFDPTFKDIFKDCYLNGKEFEFGEPIITYFTGTYILTGLDMAIFDGKTVASIGVEIPLPTLESDMNNFIWSIIWIDLAVLGGILLISVILLVLLIIRPIKKVAYEAEKFVSDNANVSEVLGKIRTHDEIHTLSESLLSLEYGVKDYIADITRITTEKERIAAELGVATKIQADMLPKDFPKRKELELYAAMTPAKEVGGDFYDFFFVDDDHIALVMADVSGKGVPAALFCVVAKAVIRDKVMLGGDPDALLYEVNNILCRDNGAGLFITVWLGILDIRTGLVTYVNAGHEYPIISMNESSVEVIEKDNCPPLAAMEDTEFEVETIQMKKGDNLFLYTDGVPEAKATDGSRFGMDRLVETLKRYEGKSPEYIVTNLKNEIDAFQPKDDPFDDVTIMSIVWKGQDN